MLRAKHYADTEARLRDDEVVQRMAAEMRINRVPREEIVHEDGTPRHGFMGQANQGYTMLGGTDDGPLHLGAIGRAIIQLAYDSPLTSYTVRFTSEPLNKVNPWPVRVVTKVELALRISRLVCVTFDLEDPDVQVELAGRAGVAKRCESGEELASFTITNEGPAPTKSETVEAAR